MDCYAGAARHRSALLGFHSRLSHGLRLELCVRSEPVPDGRHDPGLHHFVRLIVRSQGLAQHVAFVGVDGFAHLLQRLRQEDPRAA